MDNIGNSLGSRHESITIDANYLLAMSNDSGAHLPRPRPIYTPPNFGCISTSARRTPRKKLINPLYWCIKHGDQVLFCVFLGKSVWGMSGIGKTPSTARELEREQTKRQKISELGQGKDSDGVLVQRSEIRFAQGSAQTFPCGVRCTRDWVTPRHRNQSCK